MVDAVSAIRPEKGVFGAAPRDGAGVVLSEVGDVTVWQVAAFPATVGAVGGKLSAATGVAAPGPGRSAGETPRLVRSEPAAWLVLGGAGAPLELAADEGATLDLTHGRALIRIAGADARDLLARVVAIDLRDRSFPDGTHAATALAHAPVNLMRRDGAEGAAYDLLAPRSFARSIWEELAEHALPFGLTVA